MVQAISGNVPVITNYSVSEFNEATAIEAFLSRMLAAVEDQLALIAQNGARKQKEMMDRSNVSRNLQQYVNAMDGLINSIVDQSQDRRKVGETIVDFLKKFGVTVNDNGTEKTIDVFIKDHGGKSGELNKGQLSAIKASLDHEVNRATDIVTQRQMGIQKDMGNFQTCVNMINSIQSLLAQLNSKLADGMR